MNGNPTKCQKCLRSAIWICFYECLFIVIFKVVIGFTSGSRAMLGSALYSLNDVVSSLLQIISLKVSSRPPDKDHPYGYGKIEYVVSLLIGLLVMCGTVALFLISAFSLYEVEATALPHWIGIWAAIASLSLSEIVYRMLVCAAKYTNSPALQTHIKHLSINTMSDIAVIVAIVAAEMGFKELDSVIAIVESLHIFIESLHMIRKAANSLMDGSVGRDQLATIRSLVSENPEVLRVGELKVKHSGRGLSLDVEIFLEGDRTIEMCNATVREVEGTIRSRISDAEQILIHYHPEQTI